MQGPERMAYAAPPAMIARRWCLLVVLVGLHHQAVLSRARESGLSVQFSAPVVVGSSNATHFSFPAVGIGLPNGEMVQHVTLCDDRSTCDTGRCAQVLRSSGGVSSFCAWRLRLRVLLLACGVSSHRGRLHLCACVALAV